MLKRILNYLVKLFHGCKLLHLNQLGRNDYRVYAMKRILIIIGNYSPNPSSVANCAEPLINKLISKGFKIDIVTDRKQVDIPEYECINNVNIYRIDDYRVMNTGVLNELTKIESTKALKFLTRVFSFFLKSFYYIRYCTLAKEKGTGGWDLKTAVNKCIELYKKHKFDAVISISLPFKAHYITKQFIHEIHEPILWVMYEYDPFSYNKELKISTRRRKILLHDENNMFKDCDKVLLSPELFKFYSKTPFSTFLDKFISIPYANMSPLKCINDGISDIQFSPDKINCLFTGRLYADIRNPNYTIRTFSILNNDIHLSLFTNFSNEQLLESVSNSDGKFSVFPYQTRNTVINAFMKADILVNVGNTVEFQVPGKIFEYMSTGKPIIHFSKFPDDPTLLYIERYPRALIIKEWENNIKEQALQIEKFCRTNKGYCLKYDEVCTALDGLDGESVSEKFVDIISALIKEKYNCEEA